MNQKMNKNLLKTVLTRQESGFTLVELLVSIVIITILTVVGMVVYTNVRNASRDAKRKEDINAISKAYEVYFTGQYSPLNDNYFSQGIPKPPEGGNYFNNLITSQSAFRACAALENNTARLCSAPGGNCFCISSSQGEYPTQGGEGVPPDHPASCDPNGTLSNGLVGYWKMDEESWSGAADEVKDSSGNGNDGTAEGGTQVSPGKFGKAARVGTNNYIDIGIPNSVLHNLNQFTYSAWVYFYTLPQGPPSGEVPGLRLVSNDTKAFAVAAIFGETGLLYSVALYNPPSYGSYYFASSQDPKVPANGWHFLTTTFNGLTDKKVREYIDGNELLQGASDVGTGLISDDSSSALRIAAAEYVTAMDVLVDDIRIYNRVLTSDEIQTLYNGCIP